MAGNNTQQAARCAVRCRLDWRIGLGACAALGLLPFVAGCSANLSEMSTSSVAAYQPASMFSPVGYSVSANGDGSLRVTAAGPPGTPPARLEKIALARAAEYGEERHAKTFIASAPQTSITCGKSKIANKGESVKIRPQDYRVVALDVSYDAAAPGPGARDIRGAADALKAEIQAEAVPADVQAAAAQEVAQHCGR